MSETLQFVLEFLMLVVYTMLLVERLNVLRGIAVSVFTISLALIILKYAIPIFENFNIIASMIISIFAVISGISIALIKFKYYPEPEKEYQKELIDLALKKARYSNLENKILGLESLYHLATDDKYKDDKSVKDKAYYGLCDLLKDEKDKLVKNEIVDYICKIHGQRKDKTTQQPLLKWNIG